MWMTAYIVAALSLAVGVEGQAGQGAGGPEKGREAPRAAERGAAADDERVGERAPQFARVNSFELMPGQRVFSLGERFVFEGSLVITIDGEALDLGKDYLVDYTAGTVLLRRACASGASVVARFEFLPFELSEVYSNPLELEDERSAGRRGGEAGKGAFQSRGGPPQMTSQKEGDLRSGGASISVGGSKRLAFEFGSGRDLTMSQSLNLDITGRVGRDVEVKAVLSDDNLPLLPEGDTQTLEELDEVFVRVTSPSVKATFGDYTLTGPASEFGSFSRRVEGVEASATRGDEAIRVATAAPRGRFRSLEILGQEGKQGAYYLGAPNGGAGTVVPGSEKVWLDGEPMRRGAAADYTIDYASGGITFTSARPITKDSRITVDYEYSHEEYRRSLYSVMGRSASGPLKVVASYAVERDDKQEATGGDLTEEELSMLEDMGDLSADGALPDTASAGESGFEAPRPPSSHEVVDLAVAYSPWTPLSVESEVALSDLDLNTFSAHDDSDNKGTAYSMKARLSPRSLSVLGLDAGTLQMSASHRRTGSSFASMGRTNPALDYYKWNLSPEGVGGGERRSELALTYNPVERIAVNADLGYISLDGGGGSRVLNLSSSASGARGYLIRWERAEADREGRDNLTSRRDRSLGRLRWAFGPLSPVVEGEKERRWDGPGVGADYTRLGGELKGGGRGLTASASMYVRRDYVTSAGVRESESAALTQSYGLAYGNGSRLRLEGRYGLRTLTVDSTGARVNTYVAHFDGVGGALDGALGWRGAYEATSTDEGPRTTIFVGPGAGHYDSEGRYVGIGDYELAEGSGGSDLSSRVIFNVSSDLDWGRTQRDEPDGTVGKLMSAVRWSGLYRLDEHTRAAIAAPSSILRPGVYMNPEDVIRGTSVFRQDVEIMPRAAVLTPRVRYEVRRRLQSYGEDEVSGSRLRTVSLRLRTRALSRATVEAEQVWGVSSSHGPATAYSVGSDRETSETKASLIYRPEGRTTLSFRSSYLADRSSKLGGGARWELEPSVRFSQPGVVSVEAGCRWAKTNRTGAGSYDSLLGWLGDRVEYSLSGQVGLGGGLTLNGTVRATGVEWGDLSHYMKMEMRALF